MFAYLFFIKNILTMKSKNLLLALLVGAGSFQACNNINKTAHDPDTLTAKTMDSAQRDRADTIGMGVAASDSTTFMSKAAVGGLLEVELGKMAQSKGTDPKVKEFGALMVKDHSKANQELAAIAKSKKTASLPKVLPAKQQEHVDMMAKMSGKDFDKHYIDMMVSDHEEDIALFKKASNDPDTTISTFAAKVLKVVEGHHKLAVGISSSMK
jgi:putative membrane protein